MHGLFGILGKGDKMPKENTGFGKRLNEKLSEKRLSQADLCRLTGLASSMISHYCNGQRIPSVPTAVKIAEALDTTIEDLALFKSSKEETLLIAAQGGGAYSRETLPDGRRSIEQAALAKLRLLNADGQAKVVAYIEDMLSTGKYKQT